MTKRKKMKVKLNLVCNRHPIKGFVNVDLVPFKGVDEVVDLDTEWPWNDNSVDHIQAYDLVEHIHDPVHLMNEAWRVLKEGGTFEILVPSSTGLGAFQDPTHVSFWNENSFLYYSVYKTQDGRLVSHDWRKLYAPHYIKAAFEVELMVIPPNPANPDPGGHYGGVVYIAAKLTKRDDPNDCEPPRYADYSTESDIGGSDPQPS